MPTDIQTKRVYEAPSADDGFRVLVDRVWPRGMTKEKAHIDLWLKDAAPSTDLRNEFCHDPAKWEMFKPRYFAELDGKPQAVQVLLDAAARGRLTLVYSARETQYNQAVALREYLLARQER
ncbi:MAG TPA: DUF488 domain-containing protein [Anaerolineaceae bacterium]|nr:DUF488 domain-containing protein [Anaerolineaceae bacterium]